MEANEPTPEPTMEELKDKIRVLEEEAKAKTQVEEKGASSISSSSSSTKRPAPADFFSAKKAYQRTSEKGRRDDIKTHLPVSSVHYCSRLLVYPEVDSNCPFCLCNFLAISI